MARVHRAATYTSEERRVTLTPEQAKEFEQIELKITAGTRCFCTAQRRRTGPGVRPKRRATAVGTGRTASPGGLDGHATGEGCASLSSHRERAENWKHAPALQQRIVNHSAAPCRATLIGTARTMASFTLGTASQATGTAKSTILRAIKAGRLSATRDDTGQWCIDPAELARVFPLLAIPGATPEQPRTAQDAMTDMLISQLQGVIADMRQDRDHWRTAFEREQAAHAATQRLLPAPTATAIEQDATAPEPARNRSWWPWRRAS